MCFSCGKFNTFSIEMREICAIKNIIMCVYIYRGYDVDLSNPSNPWNPSNLSNPSYLLI